MSERTISDNRGAVEISTTEPFTCSELFNMTEQPISQNPPDQTSEPNHPEPTQALVVYEKPTPKTLDECINIFRIKAKKKVAKLRAEASTSTEPQDMDGSWKKFQKWMSSEVERMNSFAEASRVWDVQMVTERKETRERIRLFELLAAKQREDDARALKEAE